MYRFVLILTCAMFLGGCLAPEEAPHDGPVAGTIETPYGPEASGSDDDSGQPPKVCIYDTDFRIGNSDIPAVSCDEGPRFEMTCTWHVPVGLKVKVERWFLVPFDDCIWHRLDSDGF